MWGNRRTAHWRSGGCKRGRGRYRFDDSPLRSEHRAAQGGVKAPQPAILVMRTDVRRLGIMGNDDLMIAPRPKPTELVAVVTQKSKRWPVREPKKGKRQLQFRSRHPDALGQLHFGGARDPQ
jgi:hypothetical protein